MPSVAPVVRVALVVGPEEPVVQQRRTTAVWQRAVPEEPVESTPWVTVVPEVPVELRRHREELRGVATVEPEESFRLSVSAVLAELAVMRRRQVALRRRRPSVVTVAPVATPLGVSPPEPVEQAEVLRPLRRRPRSRPAVTVAPVATSMPGDKQTVAPAELVATQ